MNRTEIIETDHQLERAANRAGGELARHRWHWTLDESNPERMNFATYARLVGRNERAVSRYASGYAAYLDDSTTGASSGPIQDHIERQGLSQERRDATEAVAAARQVSLGTARQHHRDEIDQVTLAAQHEAERSPEADSPDRRQEVMGRTAKNIVATRKIASQARSRLRENNPALFMLIDGELGKAKYGLIGALNYARDAKPGVIPEAFTSRIINALSDIDVLTALIRSAVAGDNGTDWDAELAKIADAV